MRYLLVLYLLFLTTPAKADIVARFTEGAPKDVFTIRNTDTCGTGPIGVTIDLTDAAGDLYFDTTAQGVGISVYQPFELVGGEDYVTAVTPVADGARIFTLEVNDLPPSAMITITTDVDDALPESASGQTIVEGGEILGARVLIVPRFDTPPLAVGEFDATGSVTVPWSICLS